MDEQVLKSIDKSLKGIEKSVSALLALTVLANMGTEEEKRNIKAEALLHRVGMGNVEVASIVGKKMDAVKKAIQRAKK